MRCLAVVTRAGYVADGLPIAGFDLDGGRNGVDLVVAPGGVVRLPLDAGALAALAKPGAVAIVERDVDTCRWIGWRRS